MGTKRNGVTTPSAHPQGYIHSISWVLSVVTIQLDEKKSILALTDSFITNQPSNLIRISLTIQDLINVPACDSCIVNVSQKKDIKNTQKTFMHDLIIMYDTLCLLST
jgi:hypothetical protein